MGSNALIIEQEQLPEFMAMITRQVTAAVRDNLSAGALPKYYKFPEDITAMTGKKPDGTDNIPEGTIRRWKTDGYLRTFKIGRRTYVTKEAWQWFLDNHSGLMAAAPNNRGARLKAI